jgi:hypothetical protein
MDEPNSLTPEERARGYVLACVAHPLSATTVEMEDDEDELRMNQWKSASETRVVGATSGLRSGEYSRACLVGEGGAGWYPREDGPTPSLAGRAPFFRA